MLCEKCARREAMVHIAEIPGMGSSAAAGGGMEPEFKLRLCVECAEIYERVGSDGFLSFPPGEPLITENVRVVDVDCTRTILRVIRSGSGSTTDDWCVLTSRLPQ